MKYPLNVIACSICVITTVFAISSGYDTLTVVSRILFKLFLFLALLKAGKVKFTRPFITFLVIIIMADVISFFPIVDDQRIGYFICGIFSLMYILLIKDVWKQFKMNRINYSTWSFLGVLILNALLIGLHIRALINSFEGDVSIIIGQTLYNIVLYASISIALAYYLNSYSKKSMLFLLGAIMFACSDIFYGSFFFYGVGDFILPFSVLLSSGGYVFVFYYFQVKEEPLMLESDILLEIEAMERRKLKHQVQG